MASTVQSLFPELAQQLMADPVAIARANAPRSVEQSFLRDISGVGASLQENITGAFGQQTQQQRLQGIIQQAQSEADLSTPEGLLVLANKLNEYPEFSGMALAMRQQAAQAAMQREESAATVEFKRGQAAQMQAKAEAPVKPDESPEARRQRELEAQGVPRERARAIAYKTEGTDIRREIQAQKEVDKAEKQIASERLATTNAQRVLQTVSEAKQLVGPWTTGFAGGLAVLPGSEARKLQNKIKTIKANLGFDRLQQMRDASPTGGALGQVAVQEIEFLQSTVATLDQLESAADITDALNKIEQSYNNWLGAVQGRAPAATQQPAAQPSAPAAAAPQQPAQGQFRIKSVR